MLFFTILVDRSEKNGLKFSVRVIKTDYHLVTLELNIVCYFISMIHVLCSLTMLQMVPFDCVAII